MSHTTQSYGEHLENTLSTLILVPILFLIIQTQTTQFFGIQIMTTSSLQLNNLPLIDQET